MLIIGYSRVLAPAAGYFDDFSADTSAGYALHNDGSVAWNGGLGTLDFTMGASSWGGVLTPLIAVSTGKTYRIEVDVSNAGSALAADFAVRNSSGTSVAEAPSTQRTNAGQARTMVLAGFAPGVTGIRVNPRFRGGPVPGEVLRISRIQVAQE